MVPEITVVIAAFNEEKRLPDTVARIQSYLESRGETAEIVVVDDGSTDRTATAVSSLQYLLPNLRLISYPRNRGKGYALRTGVAASRGRLVLVTDADLSTPIEELELLRRPLDAKSHQVAIGSRALPASQVEKAQPFWRRGMSLLFGRLVRALVIDDFVDTQCGFKLFTAAAAGDLFGAARVDRFAYDVEILVLAKVYRYDVVEIPVRWRNSPASTVRPVLDSLQMLGDLMRIRLRLAMSAAKEATPEISPAGGLDSEG